MITTGSIPPRHVSKATDLLEYAPTETAELAAWLTLLPVDQAITVGMLAIADCVSHRFHTRHLQAALFALEARWAEAGPLLKPREPYPIARVQDPTPEEPLQDDAALPAFSEALSSAGPGAAKQPSVTAGSADCGLSDLNVHE